MAAPIEVQGFVLHTRPWRETSLLVDFFSREAGLLRFAARGVKGGRKNLLAASLQLFTPLQLRLRESADYAHLDSLDVLAPRIALSADGQLCALYGHELLMRLLPAHDAHPELFDHYLQTLAGLQEPSQQAVTLRRFESVLLESLGYGIDFSHTRAGVAVQPDAHYRVHAEGIDEALMQDACSFPGAVLLALHDRRFGEHPQAAREIFRQLLLPHLGPQPLQSRELWLARLRLQAQASTPPGDPAE